MKAYQLTAWQQPPELRDVPVPEPGPGQVLVKVGGAGACHTAMREGRLAGRAVICPHGTGAG